MIGRRPSWWRAFGASPGSVLPFVLAVNFGAVIGAVGGAWLAERLHIKYVLVGLAQLDAGGAVAPGMAQNGVMAGLRHSF